MTTHPLLTFSLAFHPFRPGVPIEALWPPPSVDTFVRRVSLTIADGGFVMVTGEPGSGKSVALRILAERLGAMRDVQVGSIDHPQSHCSDFYRELGDLFGVPLARHNRWGGFKALRQRWSDHIGSTLCRPAPGPSTPSSCYASSARGTRACPTASAIQTCFPSAVEFVAAFTSTTPSASPSAHASTISSMPPATGR